MKIIQKLGFDVVHGCQLRCIGCPNSTLKPQIKFMSAEDFNVCLKNIDVDLVGRIRLFNFGEALLHPDIVNIVQQIPKQSWGTNDVEISTNAQHFDKETLIELFKSNIVTILSVSCDGDGTPEEYERLRPPATWEKLMTFLTEAKEIIDKHSPNVKLQVRSICEGKKGREKWTSILKPMGWHPFFRNWLILPMAAQNPSRRKVASSKGLCQFIHNNDGENKFYVDYDGTVVACCAHPKASVWGNLKEQKYSEIMDGEKRKKFVNALKTNRDGMDICGKCEVI